MKNLESQTQRAFIRWCVLNYKKYPQLNLLFSIPNGGHRGVVTGAILKAEGVRAGVPDICLPCASNGYTSLWIEFKSPKGRLGDNQKNYIELLKANGHAVFVCYDWEEAADIVVKYLKGEL